MRQAGAWLLQTEDCRQDEGWGPGRGNECFGEEKREQGITPRVGRPGFNVVGQLCLLHHPAENGLVTSCPYGMR